ncbi:hypothetical protein SBA7_340009 [Candidatus Sulfotelmatobacter sp. SbA7]|nr:hypothetical protein SBA7_340009 [Candidatus Sulfotelmatobacter sp. SbA7]
MDIVGIPPEKIEVRIKILAQSRGGSAIPVNWPDTGLAARVGAAIMLSWQDRWQATVRTRYGRKNGRSQEIRCWRRSLLPC